MTNSSDRLKIRPADRKEVDLIMQWAIEEGWNPGLDDAESFYNTVPNGFYIGEIDGDYIGCVSAVAYNNDFGFCGFLIIRPEYRKMGLSRPMELAALKKLEKRIIGFDCILAHQNYYFKGNHSRPYG